MPPTNPSIMNLLPKVVLPNTTSIMHLLPQAIPQAQEEQQEPDSLLDLTVKGAVKGILSPVQNVSNFLSNKFNIAHEAQDYINASMQTLEPNYNPDMQTRGKIAYTIGNIGGFFIPAAGAFGAAEKVAATALEAVAPRALNAIGQIAAQSTGRIWAGNMARSLPQNIIGGVAGQAIIDPESLETSRGFIMAAGLSAAGSVFHYNPNALARGSAETLPAYQQRIRGMRAGEEAAKKATAGEIAQRAYDWGVDAKAPIKRRFAEYNKAQVAAGLPALDPWKDPGKLVQIASGSGGMAERALFGDGHFMLDAGGNVVKTTESLASYLSVLKSPEEVETFKDVALALHRLDDGVVKKTNDFIKAKEESLLGMNQQMVKIVRNGIDRHMEKDEILREVFEKMKGQNVDVKTLDVGKASDLIIDIKNADNAIVGISEADARQLVANAPAHIIDAATNVGKFRREGNLAYIQSKGLLSEAAMAKWNELYENYVSLERIFDGKPNKGAKSVFEEFIGTKTPTFLKQQSGSRRRIKDPLATTIEQTRITFKRGNENWISQQFYKIVKEAETAGDDGWKGIFEIVDDPTVAAEHLEGLAQKVESVAKEANISMNRHEAREIAAFLHPTSIDPTSNVIHFFDDGVMRSARVSSEIARAYKSMAPQDMNFLVNLLALPAKGLRTGVTLSADFLGFNMIADTYSAWLKSNYGFKLGVDTARGLMEAVKDTNFLRRFGSGGSAIRQEAMAGGVGMGTLSATKELADRQLINRILPQTRGQRVFNTVTHPIEALKAVAKPLEEATRIGEYMRARAAGADVTTAALAYRNITTDFAQQGGGMKALSMMTAFLNPAIQSANADAKAVLGIGRVAKSRTVVEIPKVIRNIPTPEFRTEAGAVINKLGDFTGTHKDITTFMNGVKSATALSVKGFGGLAIPSAILWAVNKDDQEIEDLRKSESGSIYWHVRVDDNNIIRVRKPFVFGQIFATGMENALDKWFGDDPEAATRWISSVKQQAVFAGIPNALQIAGSIWANKDWHTNAPIIPTEQTGTAPEFQATEQTTSLAKTMTDIARKASLGKVNLSPIQMDYVIRSSTGSLGSNIAKQSDKILGPVTEASGAAPTKTDLPMIGRFFARYPSQSVEPVRTFYNNLNKTEEVVKTAARLEIKNPSELAGYLEKNVELYSLSPMYTETKQQLADIRHSINEIVSAPDDVISREEKRIYSDMFMKQMIEITRAVNSSVGNRKF